MLGFTPFPSFLNFLHHLTLLVIKNNPVFILTCPRKPDFSLFCSSHLGVFQSFIHKTLVVLSSHTSSVDNPQIPKLHTNRGFKFQTAFPKADRASPQEGHDKAIQTQHFKAELIISSKGRYKCLYTWFPYFCSGDFSYTLTITSKAAK